MVRLASNADLYKYLSVLHDKLHERGAQIEAAIVAQAMRIAGGMSTEFLGESILALRTVASKEPSVLSPDEISEIMNVIRRIEVA